MIQIQLSESLKVFGLDPREWMIEPLSRRRYLLHHRADRNFSLLGEARRRGSRVEWANLRLRSI